MCKCPRVQGTVTTLFPTSKIKKPENTSSLTTTTFLFNFFDHCTCAMRKSQAPSSLAKRGRYTSTKAFVPSTRNRTASVPRYLRNKTTGFPKQLSMKHRYVETIELLTQAGAGPVKLGFKCNGMFDPADALGGHQPLYFDQLSQLYNHYTVLASKIKVNFAIDSSSTAQTGTGGIYIDEDSVFSPTTQTSLMEQASSVYTNLSYQGGPKSLFKTWNARQAFGGNTMDNDHLQGSASGDPVELQHYVIYVVGTVLENVVMRVQVEVEYTAVWDELKSVGSS